MIAYLLESALCLSLFYGFYYAFLRKMTFFQWNRAYLLLSPMLALLIPAIQIRLDKPAALPQETQMSTEASPVLNYSLPQVVEQVQIIPESLSKGLAQPLMESWSLSLSELLWGLYLLGAVLLLLRLSGQISSLIRLIRRRDSTENENKAASFFGYILGAEQSSGEDEQLILEHERVHARQWHSLDVILMEAMLIVQWFNPLMYAFRHSLCAVHEYIADEYVARQNGQRLRYATLLVKHQTREPRARPALVNTFHSLIKQRLIMLAQRPTQPLKRLKYALALPLLVALLTLFSFRLVETLPLARPLHETIQKIEHYAQTLGEITVVADKFSPPEPTPYRLYWGSIICEIQYDPKADRYFSEVHTSIEELQAMLKREPRIYNGHSLEQTAAFRLDGIELRSDYNNPEIYAQYRKSLEDFLQETSKNSTITLENLNLPNGKTASIQLILDQNAPAWAPKGKYEISSLTHPNEFVGRTNFQVKWGNEQLHYDLNKQFYTKNEFWSIVNSDMELEFLKGTHLEVEENQIYAVSPAGRTRIDSAAFKLTCVDMSNLGGSNNGMFVRLSDGKSSLMTLRQLRDRLKQVQDKIKPEALVSVYFNQPDYGMKDTLIEFAEDSKTPKVVQIMESVTGNQFAMFQVVEDNDPRLLLNKSSRKDYDFNWGSVYVRFFKKYARRFQSADGTYIYADTKQWSNQFMDKKELLQLCQLRPRLQENSKEIALTRFSLNYNGKTFEVKENGLSADMIAFLSKQLKPHDKVLLSGFQGANGVDLQNCELEIEITAPDPKAELPSDLYFLYWGATRFELGGRKQQVQNDTMRVMAHASLASCTEMLESNPRILFHDIDVRKSKFRLQCGAADFWIDQNGLSDKQIKKIRSNFSVEHPVRLSAFSADGIDIAPLVLYVYRREGNEMELGHSANPESELQLSVTPNPVKDKATFVYQIPEGEQGSLYITQQDGRKVFELKSVALSGSGQYVFSTQLLPGKGLFWVTIEAGKAKQSKQMLIE